MEPWGIVLLIVMILFFCYLASGLILVFSFAKKLFLVRGKDPEHPCYLLMEDFPFLERQPYEMTFQGKKIRGYLYQDKDKKEFQGFIILSHGMFGTHLQYICDVAYLCQNGYQVLCYDQYGVGLSEGENQVSLAHGILVLDEVIKDVEKRNLNHFLPLSLYGHSWGAYCSMGVLGKHPEIKKAVLRSGPVKPTKAAAHLFRMRFPKLFWFYRLILSLCMYLICGKENLVSSAKGIRKNRNTRILTVHAKDDPMVLVKDSQYTYFRKHQKNFPNVSFMLTEKGLHNSIITEESYQKFLDKVKEYKKIEKIEDPTIKAREEESFVSALHRADLLEYHQEVKDTILDFLR